MSETEKHIAHLLARVAITERVSQLAILAILSHHRDPEGMAQVMQSSLGRLLERFPTDDDPVAQEAHEAATKSVEDLTRAVNEALLELRGGRG